ncbi:MAG: glutamyl-tRNA reductase [Anaerolinea sp.]|nr:glutamyl-tRNA reductase [Anaerolinea sp.]
MQASRIVSLGLSYHTAPVELREMLSCSLADLPVPANEVTTAGGVASAVPAPVRELVILSTCNRLELYAVIDHAATGWQTMLATLLGQMRGVAPSQFYKYLYTQIGNDVAHHLFSVAAGLDSRILGEAQILGQVTEAYRAAVQAKTAGPRLKALFETAVRVGKRARTETDISKNPASTSSIALAQAEQILGDLRQKHVLVVGAGEMGLLALKGLQNRGVRQITVANRTRQRAEIAAARHNAQVVGITDLADALAQADAVVSATSATEPLITQTMVATAMAQRPNRPLILLDIAVPRDVETAVATIPHVYLYDADALQSSLDDAYAARRAQVPRVEAIIAEELSAFASQMRELAVKPVIADLRQRAEDIRQQELARALHRLDTADPATLAQFHHMSRSLVNKLLHEPMTYLRSRAQEDEAAVYAETVRELFGLQGGKR